MKHKHRYVALVKITRMDGTNVAAIMLSTAA